MAGRAFGEGSRLPALPSGRSRSHTRRPVWADHRREPGRRGPRRRCLRAERVERPPASASCQLEKLAAHVERHELERPTAGNVGRACARAMWRHLGWFVTISAKLQPSGPWLEYVDAGLPEGWEYRKSRGGGFYLNCEANHGRKGRARLRLSRLPGLRILSVDLGHRYAAACAVWQTLSRKEMDAACRASGRELASAGELFIVLKRPTEKVQKSGRRKGQPVEATTVYRRVGADLLPDGSPHPAPWARLDRQFLIKLQGEDCAARKPTPDEVCEVNGFRQWLGLPPLMRDSAAERDVRAAGRVDELMFHAVQLLAARPAAAWRLRARCVRVGRQAEAAFRRPYGRHGPRPADRLPC